MPPLYRVNVRGCIEWRRDEVNKRWFHRPPPPMQCKVHFRNTRWLRFGLCRWMLSTWAH